MDDTEIYHNHRYDHDGRMYVMHLITFDRDGVCGTDIYSENRPQPHRRLPMLLHM